MNVVSGGLCELFDVLKNLLFNLELEKNFKYIWDHSRSLPLYTKCCHEISVQVLEFVSDVYKITERYSLL